MQTQSASTNTQFDEFITVRLSDGCRTPVGPGRTSRAPRPRTCSPGSMGSPGPTAPVDLTAHQVVDGPGPPGESGAIRGGTGSVDRRREDHHGVHVAFGDAAAYAA